MRRRTGNEQELADSKRPIMDEFLRRLVGLRRRSHRVPFVGVDGNPGSAARSDTSNVLKFLRYLIMAGLYGIADVAEALLPARLFSQTVVSDLQGTIVCKLIQAKMTRISLFHYPSLADCCFCCCLKPSPRIARRSQYGFPAPSSARHACELSSVRTTAVSWPCRIKNNSRSNHHKGD